MNELGYEEGATCHRDGCKGVIELEPVENCSCHINPPCSAHTNADMHCPCCGWRAADDPLCVQQIASISMSVHSPVVHFERKPRVLDPTKIDWTWEPHSGSSMIKKGVYPPHATRADVEEKVRGTFGGRFESFANGFFKYIAYTD